MKVHFWLVVWLLTLHLLADFFAQTDWMAVNKSKRNDALLVHVGWYSVILALGTLSLAFGAITFVAHFATDWVTSRITRAQFPFVPYKDGMLVDHEGIWGAVPTFGHKFKRSRHNFFCTVGVDQWLHAVQLLVTAYWLGWTS